MPENDAEELITAGKACYGNSHFRALSAFTNAILTDTPFPINGLEGRRAAEVVLGLYQSSRLGCSVELPLERRAK